MKALDQLKDQSLAVGQMRAVISTGKFASAYLFVGPRGVGKRSAALWWAEEVLGQGVRETKAFSKRISEGNHPDVRVWRTYKNDKVEDGLKNIPVEMIRRDILPLVTHAPFESSHAFMIFPDAHISFPDHHPEGGNAMLKTLEEAKPNVHFVFTTDKPMALLPTLRSRMNPIRFRPLSNATLHDLLLSGHHEQEVGQVTVKATEGMLTLAIALAQGSFKDANDWLKHETLIQETRHELEQLFSQPRTAIGLGFAASLAQTWAVSEPDLRVALAQQWLSEQVRVFLAQGERPPSKYFEALPWFNALPELWRGNANHSQTIEKTFLNVLTL